MSATTVRLPDFKLIANNSKEEDNTCVLMFSTKMHTYTHWQLQYEGNEFINMLVEKLICLTIFA